MVLFVWRRQGYVFDVNHMYDSMDALVLLCIVETMELYHYYLDMVQIMDLYGYYINLNANLV